MGHDIVPVFVFAILGLVGVSFSPLGRALARRIAGETQSPRDDAEIAVMQSDLAQVRRELDEVQNRLDFTERLLAQARERGLLSTPKER
jgi:ubiquinone biosynthesis protein UbiJ